MSNRTYILYWLTALFSLLVFRVSAQQDKFLVSSEQMTIKDTSLSKKRSYLHFKNIGKLEYFHNEAKLKNINKQNGKANDEELMLLLEDYISQFGTQNFGTNNDMLWMLAQLYEKNHYSHNAKWLYRIILKHSEDGVEYIAQYYDSVTRLEKDYYVPIKYYYELVEYRKHIDTLYPPKGVLVSMGNTVNSDVEDYGPALSFDNNMLVFASKRNRIKRGINEYFNEDLYVSYRVGEGWSEAEPLKDLNSIYNEGTPCLSKDGRTMYFIRCEANDGLGSCDLYQARMKDDGSWGNISNLGANVNSAFWESHPSLSITEDTLYFTSDRPGGFGSTDVYFTYKDKKDKWQPAVNIGPVINTKGSDVSPFHHPVHDVLYFASNGHLLNFGNFDLYKTTFKDGVWLEPKNIGPLVNGKGDEYFFTIDSESKNIYYSRSEYPNVKDLNLYSFPLPMEAQPLANTVFRGSLVDSVSGVPFKGIVSIIDMENGIEVAPKYLRDDGSFEFDLINHNKYLLVIQGEDFFRVEELINLESDTTMVFEAPSLKSLRIQFTSVEFESNSAEIKDYMEADLEKLLNFILDNPGMSLVISGHTDSKGDPAKNLKLSQDRANSIRDYLLASGFIEPSRIEAIGYGSSMPIIKDELTDEDRKINRRVEFEIIKGSALGMSE